MESRGGIPGAQWCAANCRKIFDGKSREIAASLGSDPHVAELPRPTRSSGSAQSCSGRFPAVIQIGLGDQGPTR